MPLPMLLTLLEVLDPPNADNGEWKMWHYHDAEGNPVAHRDYDLPAAVWRSGALEYWRHGERHRERGLHAVIYSSGNMEYWENGQITRQSWDPAS